MAANRDRLAAVLAYQAEKRRRLAEYVPTIDQTEPVRPSSAGLGTNLENLSSGIGQGIVNQLEGVKSLVTDPVGTAKAAYEGVKGVVRNPAVLAEALRQTGQKAMSGPLGAGEVIGEMVSPMRGKPPVMQEIDVYHGSPHRFEEFDASKIGTGEGAQAYGHGIYLAESPAVAKSYVSAGGSRTTKPDVYAADIVGMMGGEQKALAHLKSIMPKKGETTFSGESSELIEQAIKNIESGAYKAQQGGLYTADLPDEMVDRMLDWDKPLSEQSPSVLAALEKSKNKQIRAMLEYAKTPYTGAGIEGETKTMGEAYRTMSMNFSGRASAESAKASKLLQQAGIPGIRYLDAGSRGQGGSGTRNFVVFPGEEKKVKILKRE